MPIHELKEQIARLPEQPGVYLYFNAEGETIYVGKARALRDRVRTYLGAYGSDPKTDALLDEVVGLDVIVTDSVVEALALENNLIKQRSPKYNIRLRDDKNYPYLQLTTNEAFPRVLVARRVERDGSFYAGPFMPAKFARKTMALTHRLFGIRSCNEVITGKREGEVLAAAVQQFYELRGAPPEIHVPAEPDEREALEAWLSEHASRRVKIVVPQRGEKRSLVDLANRNAALAYQNRFNPATA